MVFKSVSRGIRHKASFQKMGGQPGWMTMAVTPKYKESAYWIHRERKEFGGSNKNFFNHHPFYIGHNVSNVFYSATKQHGLAPEKLYSYIP